MSREELLAALRRDGEEQLQRLRVEAAERLTALHAATAQRACELHRAAQESAERETSATCERCRQQGRARARTLLLQADVALAGRLQKMARALLPELAAGAPQLFVASVAELPALPWSEVRVHPRDALSATAAFPAAQVVADAALSGGVVAQSAGGRIAVDNSLEKRLERGWDDLLPQLLSELEVGDDDPAVPL